MESCRKTWHIPTDGRVRTVLHLSRAAHDSVPYPLERAGTKRRARNTRTAAWMVIEAPVAIGAGVAARSVALSPLVIDSLIDLVSAGVLIWRLTVAPDPA